jgi:hypothetical protein
MSTTDGRLSLRDLLQRAVPAATLVAALSIACGRPGAMPAQPMQPSVARTGCQTDNDCKGARVCKAGACVSSGMSAAILANIDAGDVSVEALRAAVQNQDCHPFSGLEPMLERIADTRERGIFMSKLASHSAGRKEPEKAFGEWLLLVNKRAQLCPGISDDQLASVSRNSNASVSEKVVDEAVRNKDCTTLTTINAIDLWPFEHRFVNEVAKRRFQDAEVTRRLWLETLETFEKECNKGLTRRQSTEVSAAADKLRRIVGLDDELLIGLRSKLMTAIADGHADDVQKYLSAVTEREKALDGRNAAMYEAKMRTIKAELAEARAEAKVAAAAAAAQPARPAKPAAGGTNAGGTKAGGTTAGATKPSGAEPSTADQINDAVETTKAAADAVNVARSLFGF